MTGKAMTTRPLPGGFTLVEMLVVLAVIGIIVTILLPSTIGLFTAGAEAQAHNVFAGQLAAARSLAIQQQTRAGVHAQPAAIGARSGKFGEACFAAVVRENPNDPNHHFILAEGFSPRQLPGAMALGQATGTFVNGSDYDPNDIIRLEFTSVTMVFGPDGRVLTRDVEFDSNDPIFNANDPNFPSRGSPAYLWEESIANGPDCSRSIRAVVLFNRDAYARAADKAAYLKDHGEILAIAPYTGALLGR